MVWSVAPAAVAASDPSSLHLRLPALQLLGSDVWVPIQVGVDKPLGFSETGIVASQSDVLANAGVTVFYWSTFTTVMLASCVAYLGTPTSNPRVRCPPHHRTLLWFVSKKATQQSLPCAPSLTSPWWRMRRACQSLPLTPSCTLERHLPQTAKAARQHLTATPALVPHRLLAQQQQQQQQLQQQMQQRWHQPVGRQWQQQQQQQHRSK